MKINKGDYILVEHFTQKEGLIFQQLMVDQGIVLCERVDQYWGEFDLFGCDLTSYFADRGNDILDGKNLTKDFRKYLEGMNKRDTFTKSDLIDGDIVEIVGGESGLTEKGVVYKTDIIVSATRGEYLWINNSKY